MTKEELTPAEKQQIEKVKNLIYDKMNQTGRRVISIGELLGDEEDILREQRKERELWEAEKEQERIYGW